MFLKSDSVPWCPASLDRVRVSHVPRRRQYYQSTKTSGAYCGSAYLFASPFRLSPHRSLPRGRGPTQARPRSQPRCHRLFRSRSTPDLPGSWRAHPIPLPRSRTPADPNRPRHGGRFGAVPTFVTVKTPALREFRGSMTRLRYPLPTLRETCRHAPRKARFRLVASPCRTGVEPIGLHR